jgi:hypothetical protein
MRRLLFTSDPLELAPQAARYSLTSWRVLGFGLALLMTSVWVLNESLTDLRSAEKRQRALLSAQRKTVDTDPNAGVQTAQLLARSAREKAFEGQLRAEWLGILDVFETGASAIHGGVTLLSLSPSSVHWNDARFTVTAVAINPEIMLQYVEILRNARNMRDVQIQSHRPEEAVGPEAIRFQLQSSWKSDQATPASGGAVRAPRDNHSADEKAAR